MELTHINLQGHARMVDISSKPDTQRYGIASATIHMQPETFQMIMSGQAKKGDVLAVAQVAGIMAAKKNIGYHTNVSSSAFDRHRHRIQAG